VTGGDQIAVPAQHRLRAHHQPDLVQHVAGESVQQSSQEGPVGRGEPGLVTLAVQFAVAGPRAGDPMQDPARTGRRL
jgi:hypothetical protein